MPNSSQTKIVNNLLDEHRKIETTLIRQIARTRLELIHVRRHIAFFERLARKSAVERRPDPAPVNFTPQILDLDPESRVGVEPHVQKMVNERRAQNIGQIIVSQPLSDDGEHQFLAGLDGRMR